VEQALSVGLEGAAFVSVYPIADARALTAEMGVGTAGRITAESGRLLATREGIKVLVTGRVEPARDGYRLVVHLVDPSTGKVLASPERVASRADVMKAVAALARDARQALGET
jgi:hypothetical protein